MWNITNANSDCGGDRKGIHATLIHTCESERKTGSVNNETPEPNNPTDFDIPRAVSRSGKRPPTTFIDSADWSLYLRISCQLRQIKVTYECTENDAEEILYNGRGKHAKRIVRLVCAFNRLYAEYSRLSDRLSKNSRMTKKATQYSEMSQPIDLSESNQTGIDQKQSSPTTRASYDPSSTEPPRVTNTLNQATLSSGYGDTGVLITDITLEPSNINPVHTEEEPQSIKSVEQSQQQVPDFSESAYQYSAAHRTPIQAEPGETLTPYELSISGPTIMNSTSTSLQLTNRETSVSSCNPSGSSMGSRQPLNRPSNNVCFQWCGRALRRPDSRVQWNRKREALRLCKKLERHNQMESRSRSTAYSRPTPRTQHFYYDQINRPTGLTNILVYQHGSHRYLIEHVIHSAQCNIPNAIPHQQEAGTGSKLTTVRLPIALELILPKMQCQIERVMKHCENICDPLEVAAELRQSNYDTEACIAYFRQISELRDVINEFLPQTGNKFGHKDAYQGKHPVSSTGYEITSGTSSTNSRSGLPTNRENYVNTLLILRDQIITVRRLHTDVTKRLSRLRNSVTEIITKLRTDLEEKLVTKLWTFLNADKTNHVDCSLLGKPMGSSVSSVNGCAGSGNGDVPLAQLAKLVQENRSLKLTLRTEENRRRAVFNMMQEYLGNIRIYCRCRGILNVSSCVDARPLTDTVLLHTTADNSSTETYKFDRVFDPYATQSDVYTELAPSVCSFLDGYNVCFLTYGGEASGKTYTLLGGEPDSVDKQGIAHRALRTVLSEREAHVHEWNYHLISAVVEIYNDTLIDLLSCEKGISIRVDSGPDHMLENLQTMDIEQESDVEQLLALCRERRHTGCTALNNKSSRSHLIIFARLSARSRIHDAHVCSLLALCDLAGFEDIIKAETLMDPVLAKEAGYINRSLTALNRVFMSLRTQDPNNVSYRDSKLTYLLKPFFTHSGKCILIVTVRTDRNNIGSTQSTLRFARDSRGVSLGRARRQFNLDKLIDDMRAS
ncbi:unnamed protein product [Echinostoma caproni]|uniref:Kinesin motor domain-containing protein n=1 Tax=Echinostoma caproni TaxID=27848 RepID=A0A183AKL3_9TREM|nr:unnamed protein product [Echinostoma caproni]